jgi:citrate lyase beta subunit
MTFNEFNRRLEKCHLDHDTKYLLSHMFEVQIESSKQLDTAANLIMALTETVSNFVNLNEAMEAKMKQLMRFGETPGVEVHSVRNDPDE